jgi:hypothetical protein
MLKSRVVAVIVLLLMTFVYAEGTEQSVVMDIKGMACSL